MDDLVARYREQGYLLLPDLLPAGEVEALRAATVRIARGGDGAFPGWLGPHDEADDADVLRRYLAVHFPHKLSAAVRGLVADPRIVPLLTALIGPNVKCVQTMLFVRPSGLPGQAWHQDEHYVPTRDRSLVGVWVALDEATTETGCLWVMPGSHRRGMIWPHEPHDDPRFDPVGQARHFPYEERDAVPLELGPGGAAVFSGHLLHRSLPNRRPGALRRSLAAHYASAETLMPWMGAERRGPVGGADCRDFVLVAGEDPYAAFKEREDLCTPWARPPVLR